MVISDEYKYVFIEMIRTGSTAISAELCELYKGRKILNKHSYYHEFLKIATEEQKNYFVFVGCRNPLDMVVSGYLKLKTDHRGNYSNPAGWRRNGGTITDKNLKIYNDIKANDLSFKEYLHKYFKLPYCNTTLINIKAADFMIRFENIQEDFKTVLKQIGIDPVREIPVKNKTREKKNFIDYYTPDLQSYAIFIFGPIMKILNYKFPSVWTKKKYGIISASLFKVTSLAKSIYWQNKKSNSMPD